MAITTESKPAGYVYRDKLDPEQEQLLDLSDTLYAEKIVSQFSEFVESTRTVPPEVIIHRDAYSDKAEAKRDEFLRMLSNHLEIDVEGGLNIAEHAWKAREDKRVTLEPWMQKGLRMPGDHQHPILCEGLSRDFDLMVENGRQFAIHEIEFPVRRPDADTDQGNLFARMIYFSASAVAE